MMGCAWNGDFVLVGGELRGGQVSAWQSSRARNVSIAQRSQFATSLSWRAMKMQDVAESKE